MTQLVWTGIAIAAALALLALWAWLWPRRISNVPHIMEIGPENEWPGRAIENAMNKEAR